MIYSELNWHFVAEANLLNLHTTPPPKKKIVRESAASDLGPWEREGQVRWAA